MIKQIKEKIEMQLHSASSFNPSPEQLNYMAGLADALEIIGSVEQDQLCIGKEYYVLAWDERTRSTIIQARKLSKITQTIARTTYTFSINDKDCNPIVLHGKGGLAMRVFKTYDDALHGKEHVYLDQKRQY